MSRTLEGRRLARFHCGINYWMGKIPSQVELLLCHLVHGIGVVVDSYRHFQAFGYLNRLIDSEQRVNGASREKGAVTYKEIGN